MTGNGLKKGMVFGLAVSALMLAGGCSEQPSRKAPVDIVPAERQLLGTGGSGQTPPGERPINVNPVPGQEGFKTVPEQQTLPSGIQREAGQNRSDMQQPMDINSQPNQEGFKTVPEQQTLPNGIGKETPAP